MLVFSPGLKAALDSGTLMSNSYNRVTFVEHPFSMLVAAILLTIINKYLVYLTRIDMVNRHMKSERIRKTDRQHCDEIR